jgi:rhodanese-related sulfurtransferase
MPAPTYIEGEQLVQLLRGYVPEEVLIVPDLVCCGSDVPVAESLGAGIEAI